MQLLNNHFEYRHWMLYNYFMIEGTDSTSLLSEEELDEYLFELRPRDYPCLVTITSQTHQPLNNEVTYIYREQIADWAEKMGVS